MENGEQIFLVPTKGYECAPLGIKEPSLYIPVRANSRLHAVLKLRDDPFYREPPFSRAEFCFDPTRMIRTG